jgi:antitoxin PrlF
MNNFVSGKMTTSGEITIPTEIREKLSLQEGDRLNFEVDDDGNTVTITVRKYKLTDLAGILKSDVSYEMSEAREIMQNEVAKNIMAKLEGNYEKEEE